MKHCLGHVLLAGGSQPQPGVTVHSLQPVSALCNFNPAVLGPELPGLTLRCHRLVSTGPRQLRAG